MIINSYYLLKDKENTKLCIIVNKLNQRKIDLTKCIRKELFYTIDFSLEIFIYEKEEFDKKCNSDESIEYLFKEDGECIKQG